MTHAGSISTADGSALVRLGDTTVVCGVKAEIAEPDLDRPEDGFLGVCAAIISMRAWAGVLTSGYASAELGPTCDMLPEVQARSAVGGGTGAVRQAV